MIYYTGGPVARLEGHLTAQNGLLGTSCILKGGEGTQQRYQIQFTWLISNWAQFYLGSFLIGLNSSCIPSL